jgi:hypothetical protein
MRRQNPNLLGNLCRRHAVGDIVPEFNFVGVTWRAADASAEAPIASACGYIGDLI